MPETNWVSEAKFTTKKEASGWLPPERVSLILVAIAALASCAWILSLPLFPTQDGPVHLYYARILQALVFHRNPGLFPRYYLIKSVAPPYAFYYYLLLILGHFVSLVTADKLVICLYIVLFLFGFRFLARSLGPSGDAVSLLAIPYVFNWPLGMGFVNFCLSLALSCWALGLWCRVAQQPTSSRNTLRLVLFVALAWTVMFTHPVPLLFLLGFCFVELCIRILSRASFGKPAFRRDAIAFLLAGTTLLYVKAFTVSHVAQQVDPFHSTYLGQVKAAMPGIIAFSTVDIFSAQGFLSIFRRTAIYLLFVAVLLTANSHVWNTFRTRAWRLADTFSVLGFILWGIIPVLPPDMNNSHLFSSRLMLFAVVAAMVGASGVVLERTTPRQTLVACASLAVLLLVVTLVLAQKVIAPLADRIDMLETLPPPPQGIYLALLKPDYIPSNTGLTYDPYWFAQVRPLRRSDSILFNTPWLELPIIPIGAQPVLPTGRMSLYSLETSLLMRLTLERSAEARAIIFPPLTGAIINHSVFPAPSGLDPMLREDPVPTHHWVCTPYAFLSLCTDGVRLNGKAYNQQQ